MPMTKEELRIILEEGEGYRIEFKERVSDLDREMAAFANASGGRIFLGITDEAKVRGIFLNNSLKSRIQDIANNCDPAVKIILEEFENILIIHVREGTDKPYKCSSGFYTRTGPNAQKLSRDQIISFVQAEGKVRYDELIKRDFGDNDINHEKIEGFLKKAGISPVLDKYLLYKNLGIGEIQEGRVFYNNLAPLFFAKNLNDFYYHTVVTCALYQGKTKATVLDRKDYNSDLVSSVDLSMNFIKQYLPVRYEFTGEPARKEVPQIPYEALREALINAVVHRDYFEKGGNVIVEIFEDRIEITNPGGLVKGLTPENFGKISMLRNPGIANLFQRIDYIEKMGTGIERIRLSLKEANVPQAQYELMSSFVKAVFPKAAESSEITTQETTQETMLRLIRLNPYTTRGELAGKIGITADGVKYHLEKLKKEGKLKHSGATKKGKWEVLKGAGNE
ncbi:ATP-binding protein [Desulfobacterium sp. N47]|uniref:ATP-binding protein n=1 Tax=Desulfobacterium sp. N47 TaxID=3115210 RepID=UPI003F4A6D98